VLDRLGCGYEALSKENSRLIFCSISGYGQTGPLAHRAGHDLNYLARAGVLGFQGPEGGPPTVPGFQLADVSGGLYAVIGIMGALMDEIQMAEQMTLLETIQKEFKLSDDDARQLQTSFLVEGIPATLTLPVAASQVQSFALDPSGNRKRKIVVVEAGRCAKLASASTSTRFTSAAAGVAPARIGPPIHDYLPAFPLSERTGKRTWTGRILKIDRFGNVITSFRAAEFPNLEGRDFSLSAGGHEIETMARNYAEAPPGEMVAMVGSGGYLEIAINQDSAGRRIACQPGAAVELKLR